MEIKLQIILRFIRWSVRFFASVVSERLTAIRFNNSNIGKSLAAGEKKNLANQHFHLEEFGPMQQCPLYEYNVLIDL